MFKHSKSAPRSNLTIRSIKTLVVITALGVTASLVASTRPAAADTDASAKKARTAVSSNETEPVAPTDWAALEATAGKEGTVPVVVTLKTNAAPSRSDARTEHHRRQHVELKKKFEKEPKALKSLDGAPFVSLHATTSDLLALKASPDVEVVTSDRVMTHTGTSSNGSATGQQLTQQWDFKRIGADWANTNGWTGKGYRVAVIDTGVDRSNTYLANRVKIEACFATNVNGTGACPNGHYFQYTSTSTGWPGAAAPCTYSRNCAHGTHVAHTAAGQYGVARGASIIAIQASHYQLNTKTNTYEPSFNSSDVLNALWYVHSVLPKANVVAASVNMSIGSSNTAYSSYCDDLEPAITRQINALKVDYEIPTVISSGNDNYANAITWPACISNAISVGNTTLTTSGVDAVFGYVTPGGSNTSPTLDLLAPGTDICSAVPVSLDLDGSAKDGWQCGWIGTSMAAPQVAGAIAMLTQKKPSGTVAQFLTALARSGTYGGVAVQDSRNTNVTRTRINVANAVYYNI